MDISFIRLTTAHCAIARQLNTTFLANPSVPQDRLMELLQDERNIVLAAMHADDPIGYVVAHCFPSLGGERLAYLYDIEVRPDFQRTGVGKGLVTLLKQICTSKGVDSIWVGSSVSNVAACALWTRTGAERDPDHFVEFNYDL